MAFAPEVETLLKPETLLRVPVGLASPLWGLFAGAAMTGAAWWWMTRWARPENLEAMFGAAAKLEAAVTPEGTPFAAPAAEAAKAVVEPVPEAMTEAVVEALVEAPVAPQPVGGESAPISPVVQTLAPEIAEPIAAAAADPAPKLKKKATERKPA